MMTPSSDLSVRPSTSRNLKARPQCGDSSLLASLAVPQLVRRKTSGRYTLRIRERGQTVPLVSIGLQTVNKREAILRMNELAQTAKAFLMDNPEATREELNAHLKDIAEALLTDRASDYWSSVGEVDHLGDAEANLRTLALGRLTIDQQAHILKALEVVRAAQSRMQDGDASELLRVYESLAREAAVAARAGIAAGHLASDGSTVQNLRGQQGDYPKESTHIYWDELSSIYQAEHSVNLKPASQRDIASAHKTLSRFVKGIDWRTHTRAEVAEVRDAMRSSGLADSTVNKMLAKLCAVMKWASLNGHVPHDYTKGLKVKGVKSNRRAFTEDELEKVLTTITLEREPHKRFFGMVAAVTGARVGELTQLTKADIVEEAGRLCIDINDNNGKTLKTAASARTVPLTDKAMGLDLEEFIRYVSSLPEDNSLIFKMSRNVASKWFNGNVLPKALPDRAEDLVLHSMRYTMATLLKQSGCSENTAQDILGHSAQSLTFGLYGKTKSVDLMAEALSAALLC